MISVRMCVFQYRIRLPTKWDMCFWPSFTTRHGNPSDGDWLRTTAYAVSIREQRIVHACLLSSRAYISRKYRGLSANDQRIILLGADETVNNGKSYFDIFDWDGNPVVRILVDDDVKSPDISEKGMLYCISVEEEEDFDPIIRYDFSPYL